jgi:hypothetical protein
MAWRSFEVNSIKSFCERNEDKWWEFKERFSGCGSWYVGAYNRVKLEIFIGVASLLLCDTNKLFRVIKYFWEIIEKKRIGYRGINKEVWVRSNKDIGYRKSGWSNVERVRRFKTFVDTKNKGEFRDVS